MKARTVLHRDKVRFTVMVTAGSFLDWNAFGNIGYGNKKQHKWGGGGEGEKLIAGEEGTGGLAYR